MRVQKKKFPERELYEVHTIVNMLMRLGSRHFTPIITSVTMVIKLFLIVFLIVKNRSLPEDSNAAPTTCTSQTLL